MLFRSLLGIHVDEAIITKVTALKSKNKMQLFTFYPKTVFLCCDLVARSLVGHKLLPTIGGIALPEPRLKQEIHHFAKEHCGSMLNTLWFSDIAFYFMDIHGHVLSLEEAPGAATRIELTLEVVDENGS